ncbi:uncharacterized protein LOC143464735 isoform X2 [Clavelina lepadiformis]|uniref:uncharacterized protein LOC143464735 isoform X2 n=1 Tax=Clavelina lepadiformis TaxID=159417 RepID=UPI0040414659
MYRGSAPGQFNGSVMRSGQEYSQAYAMPHPGQSPMRGQMVQGAQGMQRFQNAGYVGANSQVQYRPPQAGGYSNTSDPYSYNAQNKMNVVSDPPQPFPVMNQTAMSSSHVYAPGMQTRPPGIYSGGNGPDLPVVSSTNISMQQYRHSKSVTPGWTPKQSGDIAMMQFSQGEPNASGLYNGSQYIMSSVSSLPRGSIPGEQTLRPRHPAAVQNPANFPGADGGLPQSNNMQSYSQVAAVNSQYQQNLGAASVERMSTPATSSLYMQQQTFSNPQHGNYGGQQPVSQPIQSVHKIPGQFEEAQMMQQQQNVLQQQAAMKQGYRPKTPNTPGSMAQPGHQHQHMMGLPGHPLQQALSPRHNSPLSPMRGSMTSRPSIPPASPQMQTARTTPQYPPPQASPHMQQAGSMPSPKQQMSAGFMNQAQIAPGYRPNLAPSRTPTPRNEPSSRGFMSPSHMMSPPPSSQPISTPHPQGPKVHNSAAPYNGELSQQHYYNSAGRFPHSSWQGSRPPHPASGQNVSGSSIIPRQPLSQPMQRPGVPLPAQFSMQQMQQQMPPQKLTAQPFSSQAPNIVPSNQPGFQQMLSTPTSVPLQQNSVPPNASASLTHNLQGQADFDNDLDTLIMDTNESFMQQLQNVVPASGPPQSDPVKPALAVQQSPVETRPSIMEQTTPNKIALPISQPQLQSSSLQNSGQAQPSITTASTTSTPGFDMLESVNAGSAPLPKAEATKIDTKLETGQESMDKDFINSLSDENMLPVSDTSGDNAEQPNICSSSAPPVATSQNDLSSEPPSVVTVYSTAQSVLPDSTAVVSPVKPLPQEHSSPKSTEVVPDDALSAPNVTMMPGQPSTAMPKTMSGPNFPTCSQSIPASSYGIAPILSTASGSHPPMMRPRMPGEPRPPYHLPPNRMAMSSRLAQPGVAPGSDPMHARDGSMVRPQGAPHYQPMHPGYQQHPHPYPGYGSHPQNASGMYPSTSAPSPHHVRPPFPQQRPHMPAGPPGPHGYMGQRPPYSHPMHPGQHQHLQQRLQQLKHEAQQLQAQLQQVQQEETNGDATIPPEQSPRSEQIRARLMDVDRNIRQLVQQLHASHPGPQPLQELNHPALGATPGFTQDVDNPEKQGEETSGGKKKRIRKPKPPKAPKEGDEGKKPPKKKKKKDSDCDMLPGNEKKKKKKTKKLPEKEDIADVDSLDTGDGELSNQASLLGDGNSLDSRPDGSITSDIPGMEDGEIPAQIMEKAPKKINVGEKRKKKPPATLVKPKKKRKRGYDSSDEMNASDVLQSTPPPSPDESLIEKRRSGRNVKRKRYVESVDLPFSGGEDDSDSAPAEPRKTQIVQINDVPEDEEVMVVEKILVHRIRRRRMKRKSESTEDSTQKGDEGQHQSSEHATSNDDEDALKETPAEQSVAPNGAMLSPTSLKNPRIRRMSMGVDHLPEEEDEEVVGIGENEYYIKFKSYSYLHCEWKTKEEVDDKRFDQKLRRYLAKNTGRDGKLVYPELEADELFNPDFIEVDRVLDVTHNDEGGNGEMSRMFLTKWCSLPYEDSTWEREEDIDKDKIEEFEARCRYRPPRRMLRPHKETWKRLHESNTVFCNNNVLRDYQFEGINWLLFNWYNKRNCILADEMGLGKTIQSITFLQKIFDHGIQGPFLIVAPLSTIANWQREFASWTTINAVVYHGSQTSRDMIQTYEWFCRDENLDEIEGSYKMHAVITTYEMIVLDSPHLRDVDWRCLIIDEAHRLKNLSCKLVESLKVMQLEHKVLLTGTPLQNNVEELFALLSFLQPETFSCQQAFSVEFGNLKDNTQVEKLQELLKPMMLRRLKEDVEKSLAPKQETIIEVELTNIQKKYYRAILERNFEFLSKGAAGGNVPNLMNTMMELRKCCNHPYLIKGAEDKIMHEQRGMHDDFNALQAMIQSSGKLVLIDKLLPRLKEGGHKVLIFSQMVRVLDILEDYLVQRGHLYERIDGCIRGNERQMAIDRFSRKGSDRFVFLLCTRAGGLGINLTAADTVIIFDSDWNPQNDLQAQARCHRIGQQKPVKVYRLITRNSYEREMFDKASLKLGLDKAVLQSISGRQDQVTNQTSQPQLSKREVEDLLKKGAYGAIMDDDDAASKFCEEDIDQILDRRAHTVTLESGEKGSTFSKASFVSAEDRADISLDDPNFWEKWAKKADLDLERLKDNKLILEIPRNRKQTRRFGGNSDDQEIFAEIGSDSDDSAEYDSDGNENQGRKSKFRSRAGGAGGGQRKGWGRRDCFRIEKCLLTFGWGRWSTIQQRGRFGGVISEEELEEMARIVLMYCLKYYNGDDKIKFFMWDLITPAEYAAQSGIDLRNHEGLAAPVPRGRKGRRAKDGSDKVPDEQSRREWARAVDLDAMLPDEGFKKHIQHQCNKVLLRVRMLYYLRTEILNTVTQVIDDGTKYDTIDLDIVEKLSDSPASWWDEICDKCLFIGIYKHGYEKYNLIRADPMLCFLERAGPPDERALAAEMDVEPDGDADGDPEYKPTRITFTDLEFGDSPTPSTPNTEPASPASSESNAKKKEEEKEESKEADLKKKSAGKDWPSVTELNARLRRLVTSYQKHYKQMQQRLMNMERRSGKSRYQDSSRLEIRRPAHQSRWTRREEADFYRTVSTFGIERDPRTGDFAWQRFRNIARLDRKSDDCLRSYYLAFRNMCEQVCRWKGEPGTADGTGMGLNEEIPNIDVDPITEERASRTLYRIRLLDKIRCDVLPNPKLNERLGLCQRSPELPIWWRCGVHDHELLIAMDRHGVTRTEIHTFNDPQLSFLKSMKEYEANPTAFKQQLLAEEKAEVESMMKAMKNEQELKEALIAEELKEKIQSSKEERKDPEVKLEEKKEENIPAETSEPKADEEENMEVDEDKLAEEAELRKEDKIDKNEDEEQSEQNDVSDKNEEPMDVKSENTEVAEALEVEKEKLNDVNEEEPKKLEPKEEETDFKENNVEDAKEDVQDQDTTKKEATGEDKVVQETEAEDKVESVDSEVENKAEVIKSESNDKQDKAVVENDTKENIEKTPQSASPITDSSADDTKGNLQMSLRSKTFQPSLSDAYKGITSSYASYMSTPYIIQSMTGRWPKDRVLIQRVEHICYCVINGEWPNTNQSLLPSMSNTNAPQGSSYMSGRSQSSTPLSEGRGTPIPQTTASILSNPNTEIPLLNASDKQLQAAMAQLLASAETNPRIPNYSSSRRGRRKKRPEHQIPSGSSGSMFGTQPLPPLPMDKSLQRKIEQLMAANNPSSCSSSLFSKGVSSRNETSSSKSSAINSQSLDEEAGNSSASLLANLRELAKADSKSEQSTSRSRGRSSGYRHHSPSPSQMKSKDSSKLSSDVQKSQQHQQFMPTPDQLLAINAPLQQVMQDAIKAGIDPMAAVAACLPLFPMMDPFQIMNASSKSENLAQMQQMAMLPPGEMEKMLKGMGLTPELALMHGLFPGAMLPTTSQTPSKSERKEIESRHSATPSKPNESSSSTNASSTPGLHSEEKSIASMVSEKRSTPHRRGGSKLDAMFGGTKLGDDSPGRSAHSSKKSRKSKFVSPAMLPPDTRIPVHNNTEGIRLSGDDAPLNKDLADYLKDNPGYVVDYQALRQQLDEAGSKKHDASTDNADNDSDQLISPKASQSPMPKDSKHKDILDEAAVLIKSAEKLVEHRRNSPLEAASESRRTPEKSRQSDFALPKSARGSSPALSKAGFSGAPTTMSLKQQQQQQLSELSLLQQMNAAAAAGITDPTTAVLLSLPPDMLANFAHSSDMAALIAGAGFLPGGAGVSPDLLTAFKPPRDEKHFGETSSPSRSSTPSRASPSQRRSDKTNPPSDPIHLAGDERVTVVNITTGKKFTGRQAPELRNLSEHLRLHPDVVVSPDWSPVIRKSKFLPKELHTRLLPTRPSSPSKPSSSSTQSTSPSASNAALATALGGLPPGTASMFPGLMQGQAAMMADPMQLMAALQQMPGQGQMDMKALAAAGFPMLPFMGGLHNPLLTGFPGQDAATVAALAALSQGQTPTPTSKKDRSSSHDRSIDGSRGRKSKKYDERSGRDSSRSASKQSSQPSTSFGGGDPMTEALVALQRSGGLPGMNPFLPGAGANPMLFPPMMMGAQNNLFQMDMMNPELLAAQMAAFGGIPGLDPAKLAATSSGHQKSDKRRGSSSSSTSVKPSSGGRSQSRGANDEQPMDLTQFASGNVNRERLTPDKHKH